MMIFIIVFITNQVVSDPGAALFIANSVKPIGGIFNYYFIILFSLFHFFLNRKYYGTCFYNSAKSS